MDWGIAKGLAVNADYQNRINDSRYQHQQMQRAQAHNIAELSAFEDDLDYMNAANSYDFGLIKQEADKTIKEIGAIVRNNPNWQTDPDIRRQINEKKKYIKSNQHVIRGVASDNSFKALNDDLASVAKNPAMHDTEAYQELLKQKNNYIKYGNQDGEEALSKNGIQSFVYTKPADFVNMADEGLTEGGKNRYKGDESFVSCIENITQVDIEKAKHIVVASRVFVDTKIYKVYKYHGLIKRSNESFIVFEIE